MPIFHDPFLDNDNNWEIRDDKHALLRIEEGDYLSSRRFATIIDPASKNYAKTRATPKSQKGLSGISQRGPLEDLVDLGVRISVVNPGFVETDATSVNDFEMPMLLQPDEAARRIVGGLGKPGFEIRFPWQFAAFLRLIGMLPPAEGA